MLTRNGDHLPFIFHLADAFCPRVGSEGTGFNYGCIATRGSLVSSKPSLLCLSTDNDTVALRFCLAMFKISPREPEMTGHRGLTSPIVRGCGVTVRAYYLCMAGPLTFLSFFSFSLLIS